MSTARAGFALAAASHLVYLPLQTGIRAALDVVLLAGLAMAATSAARGPLLFAGLGLAGAAATISTVDALGSGFDIWLIPQAIYTVGLVMAFSSARPSGHDFGMRAGAATAAIGSLLWILVDLSEAVSVWLPGNLLGIAGFGLVAASFASPRP